MIQEIIAGHLEEFKKKWEYLGIKNVFFQEREDIKDWRDERPYLSDKDDNIHLVYIWRLVQIFDQFYLYENNYDLIVLCDNEKIISWSEDCLVDENKTIICFRDGVNTIQIYKLGEHVAQINLNEDDEHITQDNLNEDDEHITQDNLNEDDEHITQDNLNEDGD